MTKRYFQLFVDTGGTFTDCIAIDQDGREHRRKVLSSSSLRGKIIQQLSLKSIKIEESWELNRDMLKSFSFRLLGGSQNIHTIESFDVKNKILHLSGALIVENNIEGQNFEITSFEEAPVLGARLITETALDESFPDMILKLGSTKGTNALLERKGAKTLFIVTKGFKDLLKIGNQARPDIFAMNVMKRKQLVSQIIEVRERIDANGKVLQQLDCEDLKNQLNAVLKNGIDSVAITLMNAYINPEHERQVTKIVSSAGFKYISASAELTPLIKIVPRAETTVANAYLAPIIHNYIDNISKSIGNCPFHVMTSAGSVLAANHFQPKDSLLSGPAGGVVGASIIGKQSGFEKLITFDMGGTSTDVSRYNKDFDYRFELEVGDSQINSSAISIETVAAGGGSICGFDGYKLFVGPESASAFPGPACYGAGGPLTITDVNLLLGRLDASRFSIPVFPEKAEQRLNELMRKVEKKSGTKQSSEQLLDGFIDIANEIMAGAIRKISISKGYDPKEFSLVAFGGAGGLHACDIADILGMKTILLPKDAGLLSAFGIGNARIEQFAEKQILADLDEIYLDLKNHFIEIEKNAKSLLLKEGFSSNRISIRQRMLFLRFKGQDSSLEIPYTENEDIVTVFHEQYEKLYGHRVKNRSIDVETIRVLACVDSDEELYSEKNTNAYLPNPAYSNRNIPVYIREDLKAGAEFSGNALFLDHYATTFLKRGWNLKIEFNGTAILSKVGYSENEDQSQSREAELELFANRFMSIAENMGALLQRTALSVNIKERLDFSCALLDADGGLVANAPHIPVHLGGLGVCVKSLLQHFTFEEGDTIVTNHPKYGGSHLPDVTLVTPVFHNGQRIAFVVNRAHHSEIGGISPGSMPPNAKNLSEEGVVISPFYLIRKGKVDWSGMKSIFVDAPFPTRSLDENLADLNAAIAANKNGSDAVANLVDQCGVKTVCHYFDLLKQHAAEKMKATLKGFSNGNYSALEILDDGTRLQVSIQLKDGNCTIDFSGSSDVHAGNMNATKAIVHSVTIYVLRLLLQENIPLNDGLLEPITIDIPTGLLNPIFDDDHTKCPAVVGGNVEISMCLTDTLLKAFGVMGASQGTMNNTLFGNDKFGYYETVCGGCGAGNGFNGASAVHHHMTNTRITDPEIMEHRYPVRLDEFSIRKGSGGRGAWNGGDGVLRKITFLDPVNLSVLTQRRNSGPYGLNGADGGKPGRQKVIRKNGEVVKLNSIQNIDLEVGDQFVIETPGGGGFGLKE